ncbi:MAG: hypothetical protein WD557_03280 [Dehalococcoidia bacterium]
MRFTGRTRLLTVSLTAVLAVGALGAGVAMAQDGGDSRPPATDEGSRHPVLAHRVLHGMLASIFEHSGLDRATFREGFAAGKSISEILEENGVDAAEVEAAVLADVDAKLDELVAANTLTQEQANRIYAAAEQHLPTLMNRVPDGDRPHRWPGHRVVRGLIGSAAEALGMEPRDLAERLRAGETVADVAAEQGVGLDTVTAAVLADANARIDQALANGRIDETQAAELKSRIGTRIESFLTEGRLKRE